tara:strand:+ start:69 stop:473 length:405 start_codon:yes stop_codon:yes gene_type:complete
MNWLEEQQKKDAEYDLMYEAIKNKKYKDFVEYKKDIFTYLNYKYDNLEDLYYKDKEIWGKNKEDILNEIKEDFSGEFDFNSEQMKQNDEFLEKYNLLDEEGELPNSPIERIIGGNVSLFALKVIEEWFWLKIPK